MTPRCLSPHNAFRVLTYEVRLHFPRRPSPCSLIRAYTLNINRFPGRHQPEVSPHRRWGSSIGGGWSPLRAVRQQRFQGRVLRGGEQSAECVRVSFFFVTTSHITDRPCPNPALGHGGSIHPLPRYNTRIVHCVFIANWIQHSQQLTGPSDCDGVSEETFCSALEHCSTTRYNRRFGGRQCPMSKAGFDANLSLSCLRYIAIITLPTIECSGRTPGSWRSTYHDFQRQRRGNRVFLPRYLVGISRGGNHRGRRILRQRVIRVSTNPFRYSQDRARFVFGVPTTSVFVTCNRLPSTRKGKRKSERPQSFLDNIVAATIHNRLFSSKIHEFAVSPQQSPLFSRARGKLQPHSTNRDV